MVRVGVLFSCSSHDIYFLLFFPLGMLCKRLFHFVFIAVPDKSLE